MEKFVDRIIETDRKAREIIDVYKSQAEIPSGNRITGNTAAGRRQGTGCRSRCV